MEKLNKEDIEVESPEKTEKENFDKLGFEGDTEIRKQFYARMSYPLWW